MPLRLGNVRVQELWGLKYKVKNSLFAWVTFEDRPEEGKGASCADIWRKIERGRRIARKGQKAGVDLACLTHSSRMSKGGMERDTSER
jgi:hypothetical protein